MFGCCFFVVPTLLDDKSYLGGTALCTRPCRRHDNLKRVRYRLPFWNAAASRREKSFYQEPSCYVKIQDGCQRWPKMGAKATIVHPVAPPLRLVVIKCLPLQDLSLWNRNLLLFISSPEKLSESSGPQRRVSSSRLTLG